MGEQSEYAQTRVGTPYYMSPEQVTEARYNEQSDIWSLGCLIYEMAALHPPFQARNQMALALKIKEGRVERFSERYSEDLWRLVQNMLNVDFTQRPNVEALLANPILAQKCSEKMLRDQIQTMKSKDEELAKTKERLDKWQADLTKREQEVKQREEKLSTRNERPPLPPREEGEVLQLRPVRALSPADQRSRRTQSPVLVHTGVMVLNRPRSALTPVGSEASLETITRTILERRNRLVQH
jgi:serine/threonine protein kinase